MFQARVLTVNAKETRLVKAYPILIECNIMKYNHFIYLLLLLFFINASAIAIGRKATTKIISLNEPSSTT
jgi:hypothetical protein